MTPLAVAVGCHIPCFAKCIVQLNRWHLVPYILKLIYYNFCISLAGQCPIVPACVGRIRDTKIRRPLDQYFRHWRNALGNQFKEHCCWKWPVAQSCFSLASQPWQVVYEGALLAAPKLPYSSVENRFRHPKRCGFQFYFVEGVAQRSEGEL